MADVIGDKLLEQVGVAQVVAVVAGVLGAGVVGGQEAVIEDGLGAAGCVMYRYSGGK